MEKQKEKIINKRRSNWLLSLGSNFYICQFSNLDHKNSLNKLGSYFLFLIIQLNSNDLNSGHFNTVNLWNPDFCVSNFLMFQPFKNQIEEYSFWIEKFKMASKIIQNIWLSNILWPFENWISTLFRCSLYNQIQILANQGPDLRFVVKANTKALIS